MFLLPKEHSGKYTGLMIKNVRAASLFLFSLTTTLLLEAQPATKLPGEKPDYSQEAFVMEQFIRKVKLENDGASVREDSARVRIQSDAGVQRYGLLTFSYERGSPSVYPIRCKLRRFEFSEVPPPLSDAKVPFCPAI